MKPLLFVLLTCLLGGCFQSTNPFYTEASIANDDRIVGEYPDRKAGHLWSIKKSEISKKEYTATLSQGSSWSKYTLTLFKLGGRTYIDMFPLEDSSMARDPGGPPTMSQVMKGLTSKPLHLALLVNVGNNSLTIMGPSREGVGHLFKQKPQLRNALNGGAFQLPESTEGLQALLLEIGDNPLIFDYKEEIRKAN